MLVGLSFSCSDDFFDLKPQGRASLEQLANKNGVNALLIGAYSLLDGVGAGNNFELRFRWYQQRRCRERYRRR
jgi:hypothetical protein